MTAGGDAPSAADSSTVVARPPQAPVLAIAAISVLTVPLAVAAVASGDGLLGVVALVSAAWVGSLAYVGSTARSVADREGVEITWMRATEAVRWDEVVAVEVDRAGAGGVRRGARLVLAEGRSVRWAPWVPFLWFAHRSARESVERLDELLAKVGPDLRVTDPDAPTEERPGWTRPRR